MALRQAHRVPANADRPLSGRRRRVRGALAPAFLVVRAREENAGVVINLLCSLCSVGMMAAGTSSEVSIRDLDTDRFKKLSVFTALFLGATLFGFLGTLALDLQGACS